MSQPEVKLQLDQAACYIIEVQGRLPEEWSNHFTEMAMQVTTTPAGNTISRLSGVLRDQPALHGLLEKIRDYNLLLLRVEFTGVPLESGDGLT
jgi:hypothetical protein